jgi:hypothetical protein
MKQLILASLILLASQFAHAQGAAAADCEARALSKDGKPLAGAAKNAFMKKCTGEIKAPAAQSECEGKALSKDGKPLAGAAKAAFIKKCVQDAQAAK